MDFIGTVYKYLCNKMTLIIMPLSPAPRAYERNKKKKKNAP